MPNAEFAYRRDEIWQRFYPNIKEVGVSPALESLSLSVGTLSPTFNPIHNSYISAVAFQVTDVIITAVPEDDNASVVGAGVKTLQTGTNTFEIVVTAQNLSTRTYIIVITKHDLTVGEVLSVEIEPPSNNLPYHTVQIGRSRQFESRVSVIGDATEDVEWFVSRNASTETNIDANGVLYVADNETAITLTITARSLFDRTKSGTAEVRLTRDFVTDTDDTIASLIASIYPNPTNGLVALEFEKEGVYTITLADMSGRILMRESVAGQTTQIDIGVYPEGVYLLTIDDGKLQSTMRLVRN
jgi:hypothetical protein